MNNVTKCNYNYKKSQFFYQKILNKYKVDVCSAKRKVKCVMNGLNINYSNISFGKYTIGNKNSVCFSQNNVSKPPEFKKFMTYVKK